MHPRVKAAMSRADELLRAPWRPVSKDGRARARFVAIGDLQSSFEHVARILHNHSLLGGDGHLAPEVFLISVGDHYDYSGGAIEEVGLEGQKILRWLAAHPPDQVVLLAGNHDLSRVQELALQTDATFAEARRLARTAEELRKKESKSPADERAHEEAVARFHEAYPDLATPELADRDYATFTAEQQRLVQALLVAKRLRLAHVGRTKEGAEILFTHAGVNRHDLSLLGGPREEPRAVAAALNAFLDAAVAKAAPAWARGERVALDLAPLHVFGR
ncbi:MAG: metallophosphoesterase, partial [Planctomycetota bacterium]